MRQANDAYVTYIHAFNTHSCFDLTACSRMQSYAYIAECILNANVANADECNGRIRMHPYATAVCNRMQRIRNV